MEKFPLEIWSKIFGYLDFETVQKTATLVCKSWFDMIRNDPAVSGELALNSIQQMKTSEINDVLFKWKHLKTLRILNRWHPTHLGDYIEFPLPPIGFRFNIKEIKSSLCPWLKKVIVPVNMIPRDCGIDENEIEHLNKMLPKWAKVSKICFDPFSKKSQHFGLKNISELCLELGPIPGQFNGCLETIGASMENLESLTILMQYVQR